MTEVTPVLLRASGRKALRAMKAERDAERIRRRQLEDEVRALRKALDIFKLLLDTKDEK